MGVPLIDRILGRPPRGQLVTLNEPIHLLRELQERLEGLLGSYRSAIAMLGEYTPRTPPDLYADHRERLRSLARRLAGQPSAGQLKETEQLLAQELETYGRKLEQHIRRQEKEAREIMATLSVMIESMAAREKTYNVRFRGISKKIRELSSVDNLSEIRQRLADQVIQLERYVADMARDTDAAVARVREELDGCCRLSSEHSCAPPASPACQEKTEALLEARLRDSRRLSVAALWLEGLDRIRNEFGGQAADALVEQFSERVQAHFDSQAAFCRFEASRILVLLNRPLPEVAAQIGTLEQELSGVYRLGLEGRVVELPLRCRATAVGPIRGESGAEMLARLRASATER